MAPEQVARTPSGDRAHAKRSVIGAGDFYESCERCELSHNMSGTAGVLSFVSFLRDGGFFFLWGISAFMYLIAKLRLKRVSIFEGTRNFGDCTTPSRTDLRKGSCKSTICAYLARQNSLCFKNTPPFLPCYEKQYKRKGSCESRLCLSARE